MTQEELLHIIENLRELEEESAKRMLFPVLLEFLLSEGYEKVVIALITLGVKDD